MAEKFEPKPKAEDIKEWKEHFGAQAEIQERKEKSAEFVERMAKGKETKKWREFFGPMAQIREEMDKSAKEELAKEKASVEGAAARKEVEKKETGSQEEFLKWLGVSITEKPEENAGVKQEKIEQKISSMANIEKTGRARSEKAANFLAAGIEKGISHLAALDKWGVLAFKGAGKLAVEAGGILGGVGLSPLVALEEVGREVGGRTKMWWEGRKEKSTIKEIGKFEKIQPKSGEGVIADYLGFLRDRARLAKEEADKARENLTKKGKVASFLSKLPFFKRFAE